MSTCRLPENDTSFYIFPSEKNFDTCYWVDYMSKFYDDWCLFVLTTYVITVFGIKTLMANRKPFALQGPLVIWNAALAVFSMMGAVGTGAELFSVLRNGGIDDSVCNPSYRMGSAGFWLLMFTLSKIAEFVDSIFIVLRKKPLIFLHYYHHVETCWYALYHYSKLVPVARWCSFVNFSVHSVMYSYYAIRATGIRLPKQIAMSITTIQCVQMFLCAFLIGRGLYLQCDQNYTATGLGFLQYVIYAALFSNYFIQSYFGSKANHVPGKSRDEVNNNYKDKNNIKTD
ncbi:Elongation of long chain fatty acids protein 6 [Halotydeus destructor]|nr:Elongation of long chain fatty acids protein 6 [Halotydeus destructor]